MADIFRQGDERLADIGPIHKEVEYEPLTDPAYAPVEEPTVPAAPVPQPEPEPVPV